MIKNKEKHKSKNKGITLIALVITIIVLLILAGVSIAMLTGNNGILTQAQNAKEATEKASLIEQAQTDILGKQAESKDGSITESEFKEILEKYFNDVPEELPDDLTTLELTSKDQYGGQKIKVSDIYSGTLEKEQEPIEVGTSYTANFADMNNDGVADGIIYADLAVGESGQWAVTGSKDWGKYSYAAETTGLKEYYIENENYTEPKFGNVSGKLIAPIEGTSGKDRFYIMALEDINPGTYYCWYDAAYGKLDNIVDFDEDDFGKGKTNTADVMAKWDAETWGAQDDNGTYKDMWGVIKDQVNAGWFVPSKDEWAAFGDMATKTLGLTTSNYSTYGLSYWYWTSSQRDTLSAYGALFDSGYIDYNDVDSDRCVRLSATF